jgi:hypothetical protein
MNDKGETMSFAFAEEPSLKLFQELVTELKKKFSNIKNHILLMPVLTYSLEWILITITFKDKEIIYANNFRGKTAQIINEEDLGLKLAARLKEITESFSVTFNKICEILNIENKPNIIQAIKFNKEIEIIPSQELKEYILKSKPLQNHISFIVKDEVKLGFFTHDMLTIVGKFIINHLHNTCVSNIDKKFGTFILSLYRNHPENNVLCEEIRDYLEMPLTSDFEDLKGSLYFIDKTLLIQELENTSIKDILFIRSRKMGKTTNMSMIKNFYKPVLLDGVLGNNAHLFNGTLISKCLNIMDKCGKHPVISLNFNALITDSIYTICNSIRLNILRVVETDFIYLLNTNFVPSHGHLQNVYNSFNGGGKNNTEFIEKLFSADPLNFVMRMTRELINGLNKCHKSSVILIIDAYDSAYNNHLYYLLGENIEPANDEKLSVIKYCLCTYFTAFSKTDEEKTIFKFIISGSIDLLEKNSSNLNTFYVDSYFITMTGKYFGITEDEIRVLLKKFHVADELIPIIIDDMRLWYNGFSFKNSQMTIFNTDSCLRYIMDYLSGIRKIPGLGPYLSKSTKLEIAFKLMKNNLRCFEPLFLNEEVQLNYEEVSLPALFNSGQTFEYTCYLLISLGCLTFKNNNKYNLVDGQYFLKIPNYDMDSLMRKTIYEKYKGNNIDSHSFSDFYKALYYCKDEEIGKTFLNIINKTFTYFDLFRLEFRNHVALGIILQTIGQTHIVKIQEISTDGRCDLAFVSTKYNTNGDVSSAKGVSFIFGLKYKITNDKEILEDLAKSAIDQIYEKDYTNNLTNNLHTVKLHHSNIVIVAMAFSNTKVSVITKKLTEFSSEVEFLDLAIQTNNKITDGVTSLMRGFKRASISTSPIKKISKRASKQLRQDTGRISEDKAGDKGRKR